MFRLFLALVGLWDLLLAVLPEVLALQFQLHPLVPDFVVLAIKRWDASLLFSSLDSCEGCGGCEAFFCSAIVSYLLCFSRVSLGLIT
jgi:hypothetical protein